MGMGKKLFGLSALGAAIYGLYKLGDKKLKAEDESSGANEPDGELSEEELEELFADDDAIVFDDEPTLSEEAIRVAKTVKVGLGEAANYVKGFSAEDFEKAKEYASDKYEQAKEYASDKYEQAKEYASDKYEKAKEYASDKFEYVKDVATDKILDTKDNIKSIIKDEYAEFDEGDEN